MSTKNQQKIKEKRARASSARQSSERSRPLSGVSNKLNHRVQLIENLYGNDLSKKNTSRPSNKIGIGYFEDIDLTKLISSKGNKTREELLEENLLLKKQIHRLEQEVSVQRGKAEMARKKNSQYSKQLSMEFEKEQYWSGSNANMVRGIKSQYEAIKEKYELKCQEMQEITKQVVFSQLKEDRAYIQMLEQENLKLKLHLDQKNQIIKPLNAQEKEADIACKADLHHNNLKLAKNIQSLKASLEEKQVLLENKNKKIIFLEKLLIEKGNNEHAAVKALKAFKKQSHLFKSTYEKQKLQNQELVLLNQQKFARYRQISEMQFKTEKQIFLNEIEEKNGQLAKFQKEIAYLSTLLSYWKPLDEANQNANQINQPNLKDKEITLDYSLSMIKQSKVIREEENLKKSIISSRKYSDERNKPNEMTKSIELPINPKEVLARVPQTADRRHSEEGVKTRKISFNDIEQICEMLKYRFIYQGLSIEEIRKQFAFQENANGHDLGNIEEGRKAEEEWKKEYITMREVKAILMNDIFALKDEDAQTISRYLIEDSSNQYVYCDPNNQHSRGVVKSIIKNIAGDYQVPDLLAEVKRASNELIEKYSTNLESALKATASSGLISKKKLLELLTGLGIEVSPHIRDYLLGKLAFSSESLSQLKYRILFEK